MKKVKVIILSLVALVGVVAMVPSHVSADAVDEAQKGVQQIGGTGETKLETRIEDIVNILLFILGAIAVVMIVIGGIKYATANGDTSAVTSAKNTILYSVVGLVVAVLAYAIVNFVLGALD